MRTVPNALLLSALAVVMAASTIHPASADELQGTQWRLTVDPDPNAMAAHKGIWEDRLSFDGGRLSSDGSIEKGFNSGAYSLDTNGHFRSTLVSDKEDVMIWEGDLKGLSITGEMKWTSNDDKRTQYTYKFQGVLDVDRLDVQAFYAQVVNRFAATSRLMVLDEKNDSSTDQAIGFAFDYVLWDGRHGGRRSHYEAALFGEAVHSARIVETPCQPKDPNNPKAGECEPTSGFKGTPDPKKDFFKLVRDASTLEWLGGATFGRYFNGRETFIYMKLQGGFIRANEASDDLIDNHFMGLGIEHSGGDFDGSSAEFGWGKTDFFAPGHRNNRKKINVSLFYTPPAVKSKVVSFFVQGFLDSDFGPTSDDIQIYYGISFDVREILSKLSPGD